MSRATTPISKLCTLLILSLVMLFFTSFSVLGDEIKPMVATGGYPDTFSAVLKADGTVWTWGNNDFGQLGDNGGSRAMPGQVPNLNNVKQIAVGENHCVALKTDGTVWAWGGNGCGQVGEPSLTNQFSPFLVPNLSDVVSVAAGTDYSLALKSDGTVWGWGANMHGQLGTDNWNSSATPVQTLVDNIVAISSGYSFSLALRADGTIMGWGSNGYGQLGLDDNYLHKMPVQVPDVSGIIAIATGTNHSLGLRHDGTLFTWGCNAWGELGDGNYYERRHTPAAILNHTFKAIYAGYECSMAVQNDGSIWGWGVNFSGELGVGLGFGYERITSPTQVKNTRDPVSIAFNDEYSLMLEADGSLRFCGVVFNGELGFQSNQGFHTPLFVNAINLGFTFNPALTAGTHHTLAVKAGKDLRAWGLNTDGQLGDNTQVNRLLPVSTLGLANVVAAAGGNNHSLALKGDGTVWAWGKNDWGQLGDGGFTNTTLPIHVSTLNGIMAVAAGEIHSLALKSDGTVWAWGDNHKGQLGDGTAAYYQSPPVQTANLSDVVAIAAGRWHSLALKVDGTVWAWGYNYYGNLGNNDTINQNQPVQVLNLTDVVAIASSPYADHSLALKADGTVWAWGQNNEGQLGDNSTTTRLTPVQVASLTNVVAVAAGYSHSLALKDDGTLWAWGANRYPLGQLGDGTFTCRLTPVQVINLNNIIRITAGNFHSVAMKTDGTLWAWGANYYGQLGDNTFNNRNLPAKVRNLNLGGIPQPQLSGGYYSTGGLKRNGKVYGWGDNATGQLGVGDFADKPLPLRTRNLTDVVALAHGFYHTLALKADGTVWAWGNDGFGQLGDDAIYQSKNLPVQVSGLADIIAIGAGSYHSMAIKADGSVWVWGRDDYGQLGDNDFGDGKKRPVPWQIPGFDNVVAVTGGMYHSLFLKADGTVYACGRNNYGQLGDSDPNQSINLYVPTLIPNLSNVTSVAAGYYHSLALKSDGTVWSWGYNIYGQLGINDRDPRDTPQQVWNLTYITAIRCGAYHSMALKADQTVWTWGYNGYKQCSNSIDSYIVVPTQIPDITVITIGAGYYHNLALKVDGSIYAWGRNDQDQLGDNSFTTQPPTVKVKILNLLVN